MKLFYGLFLILLLISFPTFSANQNTNTNSIQYSDIDKKFDTLNNKVASLENVNNKFSTEYLVSHYSTSFDHMFTIQSMVIGFVALLSIIIPLFTYIFAFRPMKNAEKRFNEIEGRVEELVKNIFDLYIKEKEYNKMNEALHNLTSSDPELKGSAINYVCVNQDYIIDEYHAGLIYNILDSANSEPILRLSLQTLLSSTDSIWAQRYFKQLYNIPINHFPNPDYVSKYISRYYSNDISDFLLSFSKDRISSSNYIAELFSRFNKSSSIHPNYINDFLNNKEYIDLLSNDQQSYLKMMVLDYSRQYPIQHLKTYLFNKA